MKPPRKYYNDEIEYIIDQVIHSERNRAILKRKLIDGISFEKIGEEFELCTKQVKNIVRKSEEDVFIHLK